MPEYIYTMTAEENYDPAHVASIAALTTYTATSVCTDQNYQGVQWDPVRRNLMYIYTEKTPTTPTTNTTGFSLWDGLTEIEPGGVVNPSIEFNTSIGVKNIDSGEVTFFSNYSVDQMVPNGIDGSDGTWRRYTQDFSANLTGKNGNGPGMTDPYTGNFWINSQSCPLYCFRLEDDYALAISPLFPVVDEDNIVKIVGFTNTGASGPWAYAREVQLNPLGLTAPVSLYLIPREFTAEEIEADYLLRYATFTYPVTWLADTWQLHSNLYTAYNREVFDNAGNMYLFSCTPVGGKAFKLYKFTPPTSAPYGGPTVGGGFTEITPWGGATGPNADAADYDLARTVDSLTPAKAETADIIPMYLPATDDLVLIEKFFPTEHTDSSADPALMKWSCTYVHSPASSPTWDHHSAFVTGYMTGDWEPTDIDGAGYAVTDAFEVNSYLGQSDYAYDIDYTKRWFFFVCTRMVDGVSDEKPRIVLVEYEFVYGAAPTVVQVIDEQGWDEAYPDFDPMVDAYPPFEEVDAGAVASAMMTTFNTDPLFPSWDVGIHDPETSSFWWSGGATDNSGTTAVFSQFDEQYEDRMSTAGGVPNVGGTEVGATPPFMKLRLSEGDSPTLRVWTFSLDGHDFYVLRLGPSETLVYDLTTGQWSSWASPDQDKWRAHVGQNWIGMGPVTLANGFGSDIVAGDDVTGTLWILDPTAGVDDNTTTGTTAFDRIVTGNLQLSGREVADCNAVTMTMSLGEPVVTGATITLRTSDDAGKSWLSHGSFTITADDDDAVPEWRSCGLMRYPGRVFEFSDTGAAVRINRADLR